MLIVKSRSWSALTKFYRDLVEKYGWDVQPMLQLVEAIAASHYAQGLYGITSHSTLCLSQHAEFEFDRNMLRVEFENGRFYFRYIETPYSLKEWKKECAPDEGFATFEHVLKKLKWFMD